MVFFKYLNTLPGMVSSVVTIISVVSGDKEDVVGAISVQLGSVVCLFNLQTPRSHV